MRYLVATDGSEVSDTAVEHAAKQASTWDASLEIVHVLTPETELVDGKIVLPGEETAIDHGERTLRQAKQLAADTAAEYDAEVNITTELLAGRPAGAITEHAVETAADGIFVGHRGLSEERQQVVGSVAKTVLDKATVPVTIVK